MKNKVLMLFAVLGVLAFFATLFVRDMKNRNEKIDEFWLSYIVGKVDHVEFKGKFDRIYLTNGTVFDFVVESWKGGMSQYENIHLEELIHRGDSIQKKSGSFSLWIEPCSEQLEFVLIGKGEINEVDQNHE